MKNIRVLYIPVDKPVLSCSQLSEMFDIDLAGVDPKTQVSVETALPAIVNLGWKPVSQKVRATGEMILMFVLETETSNE